MATTKAACSVPLREAAQKVERLVQAPGLRLPVLGARRLDELGCVPLSRCRSGLLLRRTWKWRTSAMPSDSSSMAPGSGTR